MATRERGVGPGGISPAGDAAATPGQAGDAEAAGTEGTEGTAGAGSSLRLIARTFAENRAAVAGLALIAAITLFCFVGPLLYPTNQVTVQLGIAKLPPSARYPLGTDPSGYNVLGRLMLGGQSSLELGFAVSIATTVLGTLYGNIFTPSLWVIILLLTFLSWLAIARLVRGAVLTLRTREFVQAARMMGAGRRRIVLRHLVPNAIGVIVVNATFTVADAILTLSALSFLGLGLPPPQADWGGMLSNGLNYLFDGYWWMVYPPAIILIITVVAFNLIGDAIRDSLDVRLQRP